MTADGNQDELLLNLSGGGRVQASIGITRDRRLDLVVTHSGDWRLVELSADGRTPPRLFAKGQLPSSYLGDDDRGPWH